MLAEKLKVFVTTKDNLDYVRLCGVIDEDNNLLSVLPRLTRQVVVVALREVTRINSCGVRDWVNWMNAVEGASKRVVLYECSPNVVSQINLVANFAGRSHVESFLAPYFCTTCDAERLRLIQTRRLVGDRPRAPRALCDECDALMSLDEVEESYFSFVPRTRQVKVDEIVERALAELTPRIDAKLMLIDYTSSGAKPTRSDRPSGSPPQPAPAAAKPVAATPPASASREAPAKPKPKAPVTSPPAAATSSSGGDMAVPRSAPVPGWFWPVVAGAVLATAVFAVVWLYVL